MIDTGENASTVPCRSTVARELGFEDRPSTRALETLNRGGEIRRDRQIREIRQPVLDRDFLDRHRHAARRFALARSSARGIRIAAAPFCGCRRARRRAPAGRQPLRDGFLRARRSMRVRSPALPPRSLKRVVTLRLVSDSMIDPRIGLAHQHLGNLEPIGCLLVVQAADIESLPIDEIVVAQSSTV